MATATKSPPATPSPAAGGSSGLARWTPTLLPTSLINMLNPFASDTSNSSTTNTNNNNNALHASPSSGRAPGGRRSMFAAVRFYDNAVGQPPSPTDSIAGSAMFAEPDSRSNSEVESREGSILSTNPRYSKSVRSKTSFSICHPPPASLTRTRLHRRPRSLLQLHELSAGSRPTPAFDVIPSANLNVRLTRAMASRFTARHGLCTNDLLVLHADKYSVTEDDEEQEQETGDIIGLICKGRKDDGAAGRPRICIANGKEWEASCLPNGGYEFSTTDEHGLELTVRWVVKKSKDRGPTTPKAQSRHKRFNFSTISPNSRRHPIIATLTRSGLDINNTYRMPDSATLSPSATPRETSSALADAMQDEAAEPPLTCTTDPELRELITLTSIWVTFKEGWSSTFRYDDRDRDRESARGTPGVTSSPQKGSDSAALSSSGIPSDKAGSIRSISTGFLRKGSLRAAKRASVASSLNEEASATQSRASSVDQAASKHGRHRSDSDSTVLMLPIPVHRRKSNHQATWRPDLLAPKSPLRETSRENSFDERPRQFKRASWQVHSGELSRALDSAAPDTPSTARADHSDLDSKQDTTSDSTHEERQEPAKPKPQTPVKRRNGRAWRKLWCGSGGA